MNPRIEISVVVPTYNRSELLKAVIESLAAQERCPVAHEVIIVDNNSTDGTRAVCEAMMVESRVPLTCICERKQGVSHARNAALAVARGDIVAFVDDDVRPAADWLRTVYRVCAEHPDTGFFGGKVIPQWAADPPRWLTREHWMPLALIDYGDEPLEVNAARPLGLVTANLVVRRRIFEVAGVFAPELQRVKDSVGSMEDHEFLERLFRAGIEGRYVPDLVVISPVAQPRTERAYHRRWHAGHGRFYAIMRSEGFEPATAPRVFGVPAYLYRQAAGDAARALKAWAAMAPAGTAACEMRLCFFAGFFRRRSADYLRERWQRAAGLLGGRRRARPPGDAKPGPGHRWRRA